jgi:hypothetical protein
MLTYSGKTLIHAKATQREACQSEVTSDKTIGTVLASNHVYTCQLIVGVD